MDLKTRLMMFWNTLRHPATKPPVNVELDHRLDQVEKRLRVLSVDSANRAQQIVKSHR